MPRKKEPSAPPRKRPIERYEHTDKKRINNPPVGLVTPETDPVAPSHKIYDYEDPVPSIKPRQELDYDPHLDPQLVWAGKKEHSSFEVPTVSLHVHERIDPYTIIKAVKKKNGTTSTPTQASLFERPEERRPLREEIDFYKHPHGWSNRLIAGDSLLVMNSLLEKEGMAGQVQMVYIDPPYGIKYGSNFQAFVNKREVKDGKDEDLTQEPEMIRAFRDTWDLGIHSYLTYLRDRLLLAHDLLSESGSCFVQISSDNVHFVRSLMDEIFGIENFASLISFVTTSGFETTGLARTGDYLVWYAKDFKKVKYRQLYLDKDVSLESGRYRWIMLPDGKYRGVTAAETRGEQKLPPDAKLYQPTSLISQGASRSPQDFEFEGKKYWPGPGEHWKTTKEGLTNLRFARRLHVAANSLRYVRYADDFPARPITNLWSDTATGNFTDDKIYVVQTGAKVVSRCLLMTTDPGDLVLDPTAGSGTTAFVAEQWGRRWITCDTSRVATTLAKQRLMSASFDYYELAHLDEGVGSGFRYKSIPHVTLKSIARNPDITEGMTLAQIDSAIKKHSEQEKLYDQPEIDKTRVRVSGPFTMEAVPAPTVRSLEDIEDGEKQFADLSISRKGATLRHSEWRDELLKTGLRGKSGSQINFSRVEPLSGTRWLHADGETKGVKPERVVISFGPEFSLLEQRQVEMAWEEARTLIPKPAMIVFAAFEFDPEAAKDIDELTKEKTGMTFLTAQMNADLLTEDLKKKRASNQSFWLVGRPDVSLGKIKRGTKVGLWEAEVHGFDYYNTVAGTVESGGADQIAMWMLDTDYDGRSLYPRQVFFPMAGANEGWSRLAKSLRAEIDEELIEAYRGTTSLPFELGKHNRVAVKIVDARGIESLRIIAVE